MNTSISPILIIGTQRSGSNLLRLILNQSYAIEAPHPPHILQTFTPLLPLYGDLEDDEVFTVLVKDVIEFIKVNPVPWLDIEWDEPNIQAQCKANTLTEIFRVVYEAKAKRKKAVYWCCKSMANVYYTDAIEDSGMNPIYIHLVRDGRDVAASFKNAIVGEKHIYFLAKQWAAEQELALACTNKLSNERFFLLYYENLIADPKKALAPILEQLGIPWNDNLLQYYKSTEAKNTAKSGEMWQNVSNPVNKTNTKYYREKLSSDEIALFEKIAGNTLTKLDYSTDTALAELPQKFSDEEVKRFAIENAEAKKKPPAKNIKLMPKYAPRKNTYYNK